MTSPWRTRLAGNRSPLGLLLRSIAEVAQLRDRATGWVDNDDLVGLVRRHPEIVVLIDDQAVGAVDAVLGLARGGIDLEHLGAAEVDHEELAGLGVEGEVEQVRARVLDRDLAQQPSVGTEDKRWP